MDRVGRGVSLTKQELQTLVPSFSVKSTRRLRSISASHFPQMSWSVSLLLSIIFQISQRVFCFQRSSSTTAQQHNSTTRKQESRDKKQGILRHRSVYQVEKGGSHEWYRSHHQGSRSVTFRERVWHRVDHVAEVSCFVRLRQPALNLTRPLTQLCPQSKRQRRTARRRKSERRNRGSGKAVRQLLLEDIVLRRRVCGNETSPSSCSEGKVSC